MEETEKNEIKDAEIDQEDVKKSYRTEIILVFVIGLLVGVMAKAEAVKRISIGFNDYKTITRTQGYDIEAIEKSLFEEANKDKEGADQDSANENAGEDTIVNDADDNQE